MSAIAIAYTSASGDSYNITFSTFTGAELARTYDGSVSFQRGASGSQLITGRKGRQKHIWAISSHLTADKAKDLDDLFRAWDQDRADNLAAAVGVLDTTAIRDVSGSAVFTTPPTFTRFGHDKFIVAFGLTEV